MITAIHVSAMLLQILIAVLLGAFLSESIAFPAKRDFFMQIQLCIIQPGQNTAYNRIKD